MKKFVFILAGFLCVLLLWRALYLQFSKPKVEKANPQFTDTVKKSKPNEIKTISDSKLTFDEAVSGIDIPLSIRNSLTLINVEYYSFDNKLHTGQILINKKHSKDILSIFKQIKELHFPIKSVIPITRFNWDDEASMDSNNTSAFNYRYVEGTKRLSAHALGNAIDINPLQNPMVKRGNVYPAGAEYKPSVKGTLSCSSFLVKAFRRHGWQWGGDWGSSKDYQHFEKP